MSRTAERVAAATWALIYGGMFLLAIGLAVERRAGGNALGWSLSAAGSVFIVVGTLLVWLRSRLARER